MTDSTSSARATRAPARASTEHVLWWLAFGLLTLSAVIMLSLGN